MGLKYEKYYGKWRGEVTKNDDPEQLGRIKAVVPEIFGENELPWCSPANTPLPGIVFIPDVGDAVWVEFVGGNVNQPIYSAAWNKESVISDALTSYPNTNVIKTESGISIVIDDDLNKITISHPSGAFINISDTGGVTISGQTTVNILSTGTINLG